MATLSTLQAVDIRTVVRAADSRTGLHFAVYTGPARGPRRHFAERLHAALGEIAPHAVLIMVDTAGRGLEIVTGAEARQRVSDGDCRLVAMSMATRFSVGDLMGGLAGGIGALAERAR
ncbi:hypothetical protein Aph01nite_57330 [Acrocarpospora phusangensis]|uniref:TPM domain-containing protein n=1 Tax=Acrocarpospora phusangensis TaxID=1070424 RepID=A0A919URG1_9ACTN|nr:DUF5130 family protein [Acrocarpospora phusangensis]GIH27423.1 hypothetical protein Aph01nite_57330 [Acrocarpospora phusangensis]